MFQPSKYDAKNIKIYFFGVIQMKFAIVTVFSQIKIYKRHRLVLFCIKELAGSGPRTIPMSVKKQRKHHDECWRRFRYCDCEKVCKR